MQLQSYFSEVFGEVLARHSFCPAEAAWTKNFVAFLRRPHFHICIYLFGQDDRTRDGSLRVDVVVGPLDFPGGGVDRHGVGYKIALYEEWGDSDLLEKCAARAAILMPKLNELVEAAAIEYDNPPIPGMRFEPCRSERRAYLQLKATPKRVAPLDRIAQEVAKGIRPYRALESSAKSLVRELQAQESQWSQLIRERFKAKPSYLADGLARQAYVEALAPFPDQDASRCSSEQPGPTA